MWIAVAIAGIIAAPIVLGVRALVRRGRRNPHDQAVVVEPDGSLTDPGTDAVPRRPDGSLVPGSEPYRKRHGRR